VNRKRDERKYQKMKPSFCKAVIETATTAGVKGGVFISYNSIGKPPLRRVGKEEGVGATRPSKILKYSAAKKPRL
jgi:hypothetical protein